MVKSFVNIFWITVKILVEISQKSQAFQHSLWFLWVPTLGPGRFSSIKDGYKVRLRKQRSKPEAEAGTKSQRLNRQEWEYEMDARTNAQLNYSLSKRQEQWWIQIGFVPFWCQEVCPVGASMARAVILAPAITMSSHSTRKSLSEPASIPCLSPTADSQNIVIGDWTFLPNILALKATMIHMK